MSETTRSHERVAERSIDGSARTIALDSTRSAELFLPSKWANADSVELLIHFHGAAFLVRDAADRANHPTAALSVNLGSGSSAYERPFLDPSVYSRLLGDSEKALEPRVASVTLSAWSAGYGAVRAILRTHPDGVNRLLLLDGLHTDYVPDRVTLFEGGALNDEKLEPFRAFAARAVEGETAMIVTHSEIFPGTYASTTETAGWLAEQLNLQPSAVLQWGPGGMQLISSARAGRFAILGFAGNSAPDHVDHVHGLSGFLYMLDSAGQ
jgi:pimeloyl-ACP methyl ester carboxylesterase